MKIVPLPNRNRGFDVFKNEILVASCIYTLHAGVMLFYYSPLEDDEKQKIEIKFNEVTEGKEIVFTDAAEQEK